MADIRYFQKENDDFYITEFGFSAPEQQKKVPKRIRDVYLLHIVICGTCHFSAFEVPAGESFLICKGQLNSFTVEPGYVHYWFGFDGKTAPRLLAEAGIPSTQHARLQIKGFTFVKALLADAHRYRGADAAAVAVSAFRAVLSLVSDTAVKEKSAAETVRELMECNYHRPLSMEDLAAYVHLSEKYMCRKFAAAYRLPPQKYLLKLRMEKARTLLEGTDMKVKEIAYSIGYASQLHFSAMYKAYHGVAPTEHRKNRKPT